MKNNRVRKIGNYVFYKQSNCLFNVFSFSRERFKFALENFKRLNKYYVKEVLNKCLIDNFYRNCEECLEALYYWCKTATDKIIFTKGGWMNTEHKRIICDDFIEYVLISNLKYNKYKSKHPAFFLASLLKVLYYQLLKEHYSKLENEMVLDSESENLAGNLSESEMPDFVYYKNVSLDNSTLVNSVFNKNYDLYEKVFNTIFDFYTDIGKIDKEISSEVKFELKNKFINKLINNEIIFEKLTKHSVISDLLQFFCEIFNIRFAKMHVKKFKKFLLRKK